MFYYLHILSENADSAILRGFNVFQYESFRAIMACATSFLFVMLAAPKTIVMLTSLKIGQPIRDKEIVHKLAELHKSKKNTPTMGGVLIIGGILFSCLLWSRIDNPFIYSTLFVLLVAGGLGFADDYLKVKKRNSKGVSGDMKIAVLGGMALLVGSFLYFLPETGGADAGQYVVSKMSTTSSGEIVTEKHTQVGSYIRNLWLPLVKEPLLTMPLWLALPFFIVVIMGASNAVNLTDGLDGLAAGCTINTAIAFSLLTWVAGHPSIADYLYLPSNIHANELGIFTMSLVGACFGFLWFNAHPAKIFMGDTGSLAIGAALGHIAICVRHEFLLVLIGGVFVMEALSVMLQVASFKLTGRRIFKMAPIHHHFELLGWKENQVIVRFWILSMLLALIGIATLKIR